MLIYAYRQSDMCYTGTVEVPDGTTAIPPFHDFTAPPEQDGFHAVMTWQGWTLVEGPTPPDPQPEIDLQNWRFSTTCTPFQGRMALINANLMAQVEAIIADASTPQETKVAWEYAIEWRRMSPMIDSLAATLGLTAEQIDDLFKDALTIQA
jgi:hypothetical protein